MIAAMLCNSGTLDSVPADWVMEPKLDGWRWQIVSDEDGIRSYAGRNGSAYSCPPVEAALSWLPPGTILDGELLPAEHGHQSTKVPTLLARGGEGLVFVAFDVLRVQGHDVMHLTWYERRKFLDMVANRFDGKYATTTATSDINQTVFDGWLALGWEGAVCKDPNGKYRPGARGWIKIKPQQTDDAIVTGFDEGKGKYTGMVGALRLRMIDTDVETTASGMDDATRRDMTDNPFRWIGRRVEIAHHGLHPTSKVPRHPQYRRLREDLETPQKETPAVKRTSKKAAPREREPGTWLRNYGAMGDKKLAKCIAELEAGEGDAVDRVRANDGDVEANLQAAKAARGR